MSDILEGVQILLERLETNPEEFIPIVESFDGLLPASKYRSKWSKFFDATEYKGICVRGDIGLTEEEAALINTKLLTIKRQALNAEVLKTLSVEPADLNFGAP